MSENTKPANSAPPTNNTTPPVRGKFVEKLKKVLRIIFVESWDLKFISLAFAVIVWLLLTVV